MTHICQFTRQPLNGSDYGSPFTPTHWDGFVTSLSCYQYINGRTIDEFITDTPPYDMSADLTRRNRHITIAMHWLAALGREDNPYED